ncbi:MAG: DNA polymerase III subunit [Catonella sp.]|uniref:DNA polymerase III subunit n=1 Tax=Catonella sp. TaxID=2382125 RepID=UPI003F9FB945
MNTDILGREDLVEYMRTATAKEEFSHAYIFEGEKGMGKLFLAKEFAKMILCCGKSSDEEKQLVCKQVDNGNSPDIIYVEPDKSTGISVDEIRSKIVGTSDIFPYGKYKVYIVKEAERMNEQAQNALLKTIEEPPEYVIIILLSSNKDRLLPTIKSRCITLDIKPIEVNKIKDYLIENYKVVDYVADMAAKFSAGNVGRAVRYACDEDFLEMKNVVINMLKNLDKDSITEEVTNIINLEGYKKEIKDCIELMILWFRDLLVLKATKDVNRLLFKEEDKFLHEQIATRSYSSIERAIESMEKTKKRLDANVKFETAIELMFMYMKDK